MKGVMSPVMTKTTAALGKRKKELNQNLKKQRISITLTSILVFSLFVTFGGEQEDLPWRETDSSDNQSSATNVDSPVTYLRNVDPSTDMVDDPWKRMSSGPLTQDQRKRSLKLPVESRIDSLDVFTSHRWVELHGQCESLNRPDLFSEVKMAVLSSKEVSTFNQYSNYFKKFKDWCIGNKFSHLPAKHTTIALYLVSLIQNNSKCGKSKLNQVFYAIKWAHETACLTDPCTDEWLRSCLNGCIRLVAKPVVKKEPITTAILSDLVKRFASGTYTLGNLRMVTLFVLAFAGFFRISEVLSLKRSDFTFYEAYCCIRIRKSKTDVLRQGNEVVIARTGNVTCPMTLLKRYFSEANIMDNSDEYVFRAVSTCKKTGTQVLRSEDKPLSYKRVSELFKEMLNVLGLNSSEYGLHSFRSGGATLSASKDICERLWQKHGRWKCASAKDGYVKDSLQSRLSVSLNLDL